jgi:zinc and cadmium transporter
VSNGYHLLLATLLAGAASVLIAAFLSHQLIVRLIPQLVSLSMGMMLATSFLHLIPEAFEAHTVDAHVLGWTLLLGILGFFLMEKFSILRHSHHHEDDGHHHGHGHDHAQAGPGGRLLLIGDSIHNFSDGILLAGAFLTDIKLGWFTALAIAAHEIPQEVGDFIVLRNAGFSRQKALFFNLLTSCSALVGALVGYLFLAQSKAYLPFVLVLAASSFIYIALADLVPSMQRGTRSGEWVAQLGWLALGVALISLLNGGGHAHAH